MNYQELIEKAQCQLDEMYLNKRGNKLSDTYLINFCKKLNIIKFFSRHYIQMKYYFTCI